MTRMRSRQGLDSRTRLGLLLLAFGLGCVWTLSPPFRYARGRRGRTPVLERPATELKE